MLLLRQPFFLVSFLSVLFDSHSTRRFVSLAGSSNGKKGSHFVVASCVVAADHAVEARKVPVTRSTKNREEWTVGNRGNV